MLRETMISGPNGLSTSRYHYKYDAMGRQTEVLKSVGEDDGYTTETYKYDSSARVTENCSYGPRGQLESKFVYQYNAKGNVKSKEDYFSTGSLAHYLSYRYKYDSRGNWVEQIAFDRLGSNNPVCEVVYQSIIYFNVSHLQKDTGGMGSHQRHEKKVRERE
jgi:hypothetical protein